LARSRLAVIRLSSRETLAWGAAPDARIAERALQTRAALLTRDLDFADVRQYPPDQYAVRIPREFELPGDDAIMRKDGNKLIIEAVPPRSLLALLTTLQPLGEEIPLVCDEPPDEVNI
jgi:antitoxin VapB